ncbi:ribosomal protein S5 domain 2-type protein [Dipodascopsis tothii]|uniref:ribosomal protein S5 domain 2-type protein n=1 Tax=Dipodascopsis tothii TaxID=44089 RepID=UPI0034CD27ED
MDALDEEAETLEAIYPGCFVQESSRIYVLRPDELDVAVQLSFPSAYPETAPRVLSAWRRPGSPSRALAAAAEAALAAAFRPGEVCVFELVEALREQADAGEADPADEPAESRRDTAEPEELAWTVSEVVTDRKSRFVARAIAVESPADALAKLAVLKTDKHIARATHNMTAWRIRRAGTDVTYQDCDDDGESAAGGRLLHLLTLMDVWDVMVVVTRWYGGVHLGPDRFKHINVVARDALVRGGWVADGKPKKK